MSVSIRLAKFGKKNYPTYRVVVTPTRSKRDGSFIEVIGHYNPFDQSDGFTLDNKLYEEWVGKGAIVSDAVKQLVDGTYKFEKYVPKKQKAKDKQPEEPSAKEDSSSEKDSNEEDAEE